MRGAVTFAKHCENTTAAIDAKQATSPADLVGKVVEFGISSMDTRAFAKEIFSRVPRKSSGLNQYKKQEREAAMLARKQKTLHNFEG